MKCNVFKNQVSKIKTILFDQWVVSDLSGVLGSVIGIIILGGHEGHGGHGGMEHGGMEHGGMNHGGMDHGSMDHGSMDHGGMDHGGMEHGSMEHNMNHGTEQGMDHAMDHTTEQGMGHEMGHGLESTEIHTMDHKITSSTDDRERTNIHRLYYDSPLARKQHFGSRVAGAIEIIAAGLVVAPRESALFFRSDVVPVLVAVTEIVPALGEGDRGVALVIRRAAVYAGVLATRPHLRVYVEQALNRTVTNLVESSRIDATAVVGRPVIALVAPAEASLARGSGYHLMAPIFEQNGFVTPCEPLEQEHLLSMHSAFGPKKWHCSDVLHEEYPTDDNEPTSFIEKIVAKQAIPVDVNIIVDGSFEKDAVNSHESHEEANESETSDKADHDKLFHILTAEIPVVEVEDIDYYTKTESEDEKKNDEKSVDEVDPSMQSSEDDHQAISWLDALDQTLNFLSEFEKDDDVPDPENSNEEANSSQNSREKHTDASSIETQFAQVHTNYETSGVPKSQSTEQDVTLLRYVARHLEHIVGKQPTARLVLRKQK
ncbi:unnamed protein product [Trichogramma brassicae]|uniref:Uncharacterized protein n=1 Tax=Trichogramma brassicae TaxID=86971 RepID=A0A6H5IRF7_9HYME|nr:unnamed protein product [Trichogramma brassicae]